MTKCTSFEEQKYGRCIRENVWHCYPLLTFVWKPYLRFLLNCFVRQIKGFYQGSLGSEVDFRDTMSVSQYILAKNEIFKKLEHDFVDKRALMTTTLLSSSHWKILVPFCLQKSWKLLVKYRRIIQKNKLCHPEQQ